MVYGGVWCSGVWWGASGWQCVMVCGASADALTAVSRVDERFMIWLIGDQFKLETEMLR